MADCTDIVAEALPQGMGLTPRLREELKDTVARWAEENSARMVDRRCMLGERAVTAALIQARDTLLTEGEDGLGRLPQWQVAAYALKASGSLDVSELAEMTPQAILEEMELSEADAHVESARDESGELPGIKVVRTRAQ